MVNINVGCPFRNPFDCIGALSDLLSAGPSAILNSTGVRAFSWGYMHPSTLHLHLMLFIDVSEGRVAFFSQQDIFLPQTHIALFLWKGKKKEYFALSRWFYEMKRNSFCSSSCRTEEQIHQSSAQCCCWTLSHWYISKNSNTQTLIQNYVRWWSGHHQACWRFQNIHLISGTSWNASSPEQRGADSCATCKWTHLQALECLKAAVIHVWHIKDTIII